MLFVRFRDFVHKFSMSSESGRGILVERSFNPFCRSFHLGWDNIVRVVFYQSPNAWRKNRQGQGFAQIWTNPELDDDLWIPWHKNWNDRIPETVAFESRWHVRINPFTLESLGPKV